MITNLSNQSIKEEICSSTRSAISDSSSECSNCCLPSCVLLTIFEATMSGHNSGARRIPEVRGAIGMENICDDFPHNNECRCVLNVDLDSKLKPLFD